MGGLIEAGGRIERMGDVAAIWRHLDYDVPSGGPIADMDFSGPAVGVVFRW